MLNTSRLRILREVASRGTIAGAADALWLSPSAVSQAMSALEREAGMPLLERTARSVRLTDAGRLLAEHAERILADCELAVADLEALRGEVTGVLRVSAFPTAAQALLVPALDRLRERCPSYSVMATDLEPHESMPALKVGELDLVISHEYSLLPPYEDPGVDRYDLLTERMLIALPAKHPLAERPIRLADFAREQWIVGREATFCRDVVVRAANFAGFDASIGMQSNDFRVIATAVARGLGVALMPSIADLRGIDGVVLQPLADPAIERRLFAAVRKGSGTAPGLSAAIEELTAVAREVARTL